MQSRIMDGKFALEDIQISDWNETTLLRANDKALQRISGNVNEIVKDSSAPKEDKKHKNGNAIKVKKESSSTKEDKKQEWKAGDCCRAKYPDDNLYYEAKVISFNGDFCTVEYFGYGDTEEIDLLQLKESKGKKARKTQIKAALTEGFNYNSMDEIEDAPGECTAIVSHREKKVHIQLPEDNATTLHQKYSALSFAPPANYCSLPPFTPINLPFTQHPVSTSQYPMPSALPLPKSENDPTFFPMLAAWYMTGYNSGVFTAQKREHQNQCCCSPSKHCK